MLPELEKNVTPGTSAKVPWYKGRAFTIFMVVVFFWIVGQFTKEEPPAPKPVVKNAYGIQDNIYYDEDQKAWGWTPIFKWPVSPMTRMTCEVTGLDKDGKAIAADTFEANTLNDGTVIYYGAIRNDYVTKEVAKAIKDYRIKCDK